MKLSLNKIYKGRYEKVSGDIKVTVEKEAYSMYWRGTVEQYTNTAKDLTGKDVKCYNILFDWRSSTKREISQRIVSFIKNN